MILALFELGLAEALICEFKVVGVLDHFVWAVPPFLYGQFHEWRYPNSWMVYFMENPKIFHG